MPAPVVGRLTFLCRHPGTQRTMPLQDVSTQLDHYIAQKTQVEQLPCGRTEVTFLGLPTSRSRLSNVLIKGLCRAALHVAIYSAVRNRALPT